jgi:uncharacterized paraquat-inducible protein A
MSKNTHYSRENLKPGDFCSSCEMSFSLNRVGWWIGEEHAFPCPRCTRQWRTIGLDPDRTYSDEELKIMGYL